MEGRIAVEIYRKEVQTDAEGMSLQQLFTLLQDAAGEQCAPLHLTGPDLEKIGLMWVIVKYRAEITRWPHAGETIRLNTWPGQARHGMMPRFYRIESETGETMLEVSSVWAVVDRKSRSMVNGEVLGVRLPVPEVAAAIRLPGSVKRIDTDGCRIFTVPESYLDSNGHMNNTYYYSVAEDCIGRDARDGTLRAAATEHVSEALCGEEMSLRWGEKDGLWYIVGEHGEKTVFRMNLLYSKE